MLQKKCSSVQKGGRNRRAANIKSEMDIYRYSKGLGIKSYEKQKLLMHFSVRRGEGGGNLGKPFSPRKQLKLSNAVPKLKKDHHIKKLLKN